MNWKKTGRGYEPDYTLEQKLASEYFQGKGYVDKRTARQFNTLFSLDNYYNRHTRDAGIAAIVLTVVAGILLLAGMVTVILSLAGVAPLQSIWGGWSDALFGVNFVIYILLALFAILFGLLLAMAIRFFRSVWHFLVACVAIVVAFVAAGSAIYARPIAISNSAVYAVEDKIEAIRIINTDSLPAIEEAERAYGELTDDQKKKVDNYDYLADARKLYSAALTFEGVNEITPDSLPAIQRAEAAASSLSDDQINRIQNNTLILRARDLYELCIDFENIGRVTRSDETRIEELDTRYNNFSALNRNRISNSDKLAHAKAVLEIYDVFYSDFSGGFSVSVGDEIHSVYSETDAVNVLNDESIYGEADTFTVFSADCEWDETTVLNCFPAIDTICYRISYRDGDVLIKIGDTSIARHIVGLNSSYYEVTFSLEYSKTDSLELIFENCNITAEEGSILDLLNASASTLSFIGNNVIRTTTDGAAAISAHDLTVILHEGADVTVRGGKGGMGISADSLLFTAPEEEETAQSDPVTLPSMKVYGGNGSKDSDLVSVGYVGDAGGVAISAKTVKIEAPISLTAKGGDGANGGAGVGYENYYSYSSDKEVVDGGVGMNGTDGGAALSADTFEVNAAAPITLTGGKGGNGGIGGAGGETNSSSAPPAGDGGNGGSGGNGGNGATVQKSFTVKGGAEIVLAGGNGGNGGGGGKGGNSDDKGVMQGGKGGDGGSGGKGGYGASITDPISLSDEESAVTFQGGNGGNGGYGGKGGNGNGNRDSDNDLGGNGGNGGNGGDSGAPVSGSIKQSEGELALIAANGGNGGRGGDGGNAGRETQAGDGGNGGNGGNAYVVTFEEFGTEESKEAMGGNGGNGGTRGGDNGYGASIKGKDGNGGNGGSLYTNGTVTYRGANGKPTDTEGVGGNGGNGATFPSDDDQ